MRFRVVIALVFCISLGAQAPSEEGRWAFQPEPDTFSPDALLDLRFLNEAEAGQSGFIRVDENGDFVLGDGSPVRFWAVNTNVGREQPFVVKPRGRKTEPDLARHARFLAKRGVNMVRCHAHLNPDLKANPTARPGDINTKERDWIWRTVAAMKKEGIYTTVSPYWANTMSFSASWDFPGGSQLDAHALLFFDARLQAAYKSWLKALLTETNPYTGIPLCQDPALAILQIQNEDSLLFWTVNNLKGEHRAALGRRFATWVAAKYGSLEQAYVAWNNNRVKGDDPANGILDFHNLYEMTQNRSGGFGRRLADQLEFWTRLMYEFNAGIYDYVRNDLGCGQLINAGNWKSGDPVRLEDAERYSYTSTDIIAKNRYFSGVHNGPNRGWAIVRGDEFTSPSILKDPRDFPLNLKQVEGYPMLVTESAWVMPSAYATEGPFLVSAYQSVTGIDAFYWFATSDDEWTPPQSANGYLASQQKWLFGNPDMLGNFPAAALLYRKGYVQRAHLAVREERTLADLWQRRTPIITEAPTYDPNRDAGDIAPESSVQSGVDPRAFLAGPVLLNFNGDPSRSHAADPSEYLDGDGATIYALNGQVRLNPEKGYCTIDAPKAQGVAAFFSNQRDFQLGDVRVSSGNSYGAVLVVALDDQPLAESRKVLVQVGTQSRPTGWQETPKRITTSDGRSFDGFQVADFGSAPWQVVRADVEVTIFNPNLQSAVVLDMNGMPRGDPIPVGGQAAGASLAAETGGVRLRFPPDAMYVVLR